MDHNQTVLNQIVRFAYSLAFFLTLSAVAVLVDLLSEWVRQLGVADFTYYLIALTAHFMLVLDVLLFCCFVLYSAWDFLKGEML